jgi:inosose dehydratase
VIRVANAPVSYGAFEVTVGASANVPGADEVLAAIAEAGYEGTELGPPGYLGDSETLPRRLERHGLELAGAYIPMRFSEPEHREADLAALRATLALLEAAGGGRPVLADAGSPARRARAGRGVDGLDEAGWRRLVEGVNGATALVRARGLEPVFHHHAGTFVETSAEIERLLEATDVALLLDSGHLVLGGGDPVTGLRRWRTRVGHVHVKDVNRTLLARALGEGADMAELWRRGIFCELGEGDADVEAFVAELRASAYDGWLVVEQDQMPAPDADVRDAAAAQARNRRWLADRTGL